MSQGGNPGLRFSSAPKAVGSPRPHRGAPFPLARAPLSLIYMFLRFLFLELVNCTEGGGGRGGRSWDRIADSRSLKHVGVMGTFQGRWNAAGEPTWWVSARSAKPVVAVRTAGPSGQVP